MDPPRQREPPSGVQRFISECTFRPTREDEGALVVAVGQGNKEKQKTDGGEKKERTCWWLGFDVGLWRFRSFFVFNQYFICLILSLTDVRTARSSYHYRVEWYATINCSVQSFVLRLERNYLKLVYLWSALHRSKGTRRDVHPTRLILPAVTWRVGCCVVDPRKDS